MKQLLTTLFIYRLEAFKKASVRNMDHEHKLRDIISILSQNGISDEEALSMTIEVDLVVMKNINEEEELKAACFSMYIT